MGLSALSFCFSTNTLSHTHGTVLLLLLLLRCLRDPEFTGFTYRVAGVGVRDAAADLGACVELAVTPGLAQDEGDGVRDDGDVAGGGVVLGGGEGGEGREEEGRGKHVCGVDVEGLVAVVLWRVVEGLRPIDGEVVVRGERREELSDLTGAYASAFFAGPKQGMDVLFHVTAAGCAAGGKDRLTLSIDGGLMMSDVAGG